MKSISCFLIENNKIIYIILALICATPYVMPPTALLIGIVFALTLGLPFPVANKKASKYLLQISVVGLGFGMNLHESLKAGMDGIFITIASVVTVMLIGIWFGRRMNVGEKISYLISGGTAICGGSAIAAMGPVAKADEHDMSISLSTIFVLNAVALFIFPPLGHLLNLSEHQFGLWSAIAIHDTSSVVGAGSAYGEEALKVATTVKLTRALWIIPLSIFTSFYFKSKGDKMYIPWFIFFFVLAMLMNTYLALPKLLTTSIVSAARQSLTLTLFFIGAGLSRKTLKSVGVRPLLFALMLWLLIGTGSLAFVYFMIDH